MVTRAIWLGVAAVLAAASGVRADRQMIAPGIGSQTSVVADAGPNGVCETSAPRADVQAIPVGASEPNGTAIECGVNRTADTVAAGDDVQLIAVGDHCGNPNADVIDTGPNGIAESTAAVDDEQVIPVGQGTPNAECVKSGANGLADVADPLGGDDVRHVPAGRAEPNTTVIRCGPNQVAETFANNAGGGGDDVQLVPVGGSCANSSTQVVDSGANGIAETRAQGVDLLIVSAARLQRVAIPRKRHGTARRIKVAVVNREFGSSAPPSRGFALTTSASGCPGGTVVEIDADARAAGVQATSSVGLKGKAKGSVVVAFEVGDVTTADRGTPLRCAVTISVAATDVVDAVDDAANTGNNATRVELEVVDMNDL